MTERIRPVLVVLALAFACGLTPNAAAQESWPTRPVKVVVPSAAGGSSDVVARALAQSLAKRWGQPVVVENAAGAGGAVGAQKVTRSDDGHSLLLGTFSAQVIQPLLQGPAFSSGGLAPVSLLAETPYVLVGRKDLASKDVKDLVQLLKQNPGKLTYASPGNGTLPHLGMEVLTRHMGGSMVHVPYKGAAPALMDLIDGRIDLMLGTVPEVIQHARTGRVKVLGVTGRARLAELPAVPTLAESGVPGVEYSHWVALLAPASISPQLAERIAGHVQAAVADPEVKRHIENLGMTPRASSPGELTLRIGEEHSRLGRQLSALGRGLGDGLGRVLACPQGETWCPKLNRCARECK